MSYEQSETLSTLIGAMNAKGIRYGIWKNLYEVSQNDDFEYDFDIYLENKDFHLFMDVLREFIVFKASYKFSQFPDIHHFFVFDKAKRKFVHLHVYTKLHTGHTWTKEYTLQLPEYNFEEWLHIDSIKQNWKFLPKAYLLEIDNVRNRLKTRNIFNKIYFERGSSNHALESQFLRLINDKGPRDIAVQFNSRLDGFNYLNSLFAGLYHRLLGRLISKSHRQLESGRIIAITGIDGSGKSTLVAGLFQELSKLNVGVKIISPGRLTKPKIDKSVSRSTYLKNIRSLLVGIVRLALCNVYARYYKKRGFIVIADRWPGVKLGEMDSPKIKSGYLGFFEKIIYNKIMPADVIIRLEVSLSTLLLRNKMRDKVGKETDMEIQSRFDTNKDMIPKCKQFFIYENNSSQQDAENSILKILSDICL